MSKKSANQLPILVLTAGEPGGIGPELCVDALLGDCRLPMVVFGDGDLLRQRAKAMGRQLELTEYPAQLSAPLPHRALVHCPLQKAAAPGEVLSANAPHVLAQLKGATTACLDGGLAAMITAPISKKSICDFGEHFVGQTEYLANLCQAPHPVMLLAGQKMCVALATRHMPLAQVASALSVEDLHRTFCMLNARWIFGKRPHLAVAGLNPHAGEGGVFGDEEQLIIAPAIARAQQDGVSVSGPHSADSMFRFVKADCYVAMYHDQGLPVIKTTDFEHVVNVTLGLPFLRTSPDHGPAAQQMQARRDDNGMPGGLSPLSMRAAVSLAAATLLRGGVVASSAA